MRAVFVDRTSSVSLTLHIPVQEIAAEWEEATTGFIFA